MKFDNEDAVQAAVSAVEDLCAPDRMGKIQAIDFLEDVISVLEAGIEALKNEIKNEIERWTT